MFGAYIVNNILGGEFMADNGNKTADFDAKAMIDDLVAKAQTQCP